MSDFSSVQGSVTLRKMRTGATASISLSTSKQLFQLYKETDGEAVFTPDWTVTANQPKITVNASSSGGSEIYIDTVLWKINNQSVTSLLSSGEYEIRADSEFSLKIKANLARQDLLNFNSGTLTAEVTFHDGAENHYSVTKSETIRVQQMAEDGYYVFIDASRGYVDKDDVQPNVTLTAYCIQNGNPVSDGITFKWYNSTSTASNLGTQNTLTVKPDMVNGSQLFICRAYNGNDIEVDAEGVTIIDRSDPCYIRADAQQYKGGSSAGITAQNNVTGVDVGEQNEKTRVTFSVVNPDGSAYGNAKAWTAQKLHAASLKLIGEVSGASYTTDTDTVDPNYNTQTATNSSSIDIDVLDADFIRMDSTLHKTVSDEVIVTATATI